jgi:hypothetical protein
MATKPLHDRDARSWLIREAKAQRARELRAAAHQALGAMRWRGVAVACVACLVAVGISACAG